METPKFIEGFEKQASLKKEAFIGSIVGAAAKGAGNYVMKNPIKSLMAAATVAGGVSETSNAFSKAVNRAPELRNIGMTPTY